MNFLNRPGRESLLSAALLLIVPLSAWATLGEKESSVALDAKALLRPSAVHAETRSYANGRYRVKVIGDAGCKIKEFVTADGVVFAVAWTGRHHPDLKSLLGKYSGGLTGADHSIRRQGHSPISFRSAGAVVELGGHMRAIRGRAYVASLLPSGVPVSDIQF